MTFAHPSVLLLLALPVALVLWELFHRGRKVPLPFDHVTHRKRRVLPKLLFTANLLPAALLAVTVLLLAVPQKLGYDKKVREVTNIEICLDVSGSMGWGMGGGTRSRYAVAMEAISAFTENREGDACGLTIFGGEHIRWTPLTKDLRAISLATPFLDPNKMPVHMRSTRIGAALRSCIGTLSDQEEGDRLIVLVSDGVSSDLGGGNADKVGTELEEHGIVLYAIHIGDGAAPAQLSEVVAPTGGEVFAAHDPAGLQSIFDHIDRMQPVKLKPAGGQPVEDFKPFARVGLAILALQLLAWFGLRYTPW